MKKRKRKNYLKLFVHYCKKHEISYFVTREGWLETLYDGKINQPIYYGDYYPIGSKAAYELLLKEHQQGR